MAAGQDLQQARALYQKTQYEEALKAIGGRKDAPAMLLAGQSYIGLEDYKKAIDVLEKAGTDSESHLWLGRAYGHRAETAMPLLAPRYATKARQAFEKAIELDPKNILAMNDLFEYYMQAPGFLGLLDSWVGGKTRRKR
jgi:tetratricopeptide (TPR) repeat protein